MLKHATINRTNRAQQALQLQRNCQQPIIEESSPALVEQIPPDQLDSDAPSDSNNNNLKQNEQCQPPMQTPSPLPISYDSSPTHSLLSTPTKQRSSSATGLLSSSIRLATGSLGRSPVKNLNSASPNLSASNKCASESMIKVFAQTLSQDVEYVTLHVNTQTKSNQVVKSLLKKFRLKHRDPNLFYLTLQRWIRKDGLKFKSVMLLGDEACPLQLQQCCSNPPHNDIKFTLQMRTGALVKIFCSDVVPDARYKCLSLSTQTTVEETIELMLHCLNLAQPSNSVANNNSQTNLRSSSSPVGSTSSSVSSHNSSSSGIESDPTDNQRNHKHNRLTVGADSSAQLDSESRASSVTSISSSSNISSLSSSVIDQYCLVIECKDSKFKRILDSDEYLVDVYHNLLADAKGQPVSPLNSKPPFDAYGNPTSPDSSIKEQPDQWFFIKLKRRGYDLTSNNSRLNSNTFSSINKFNTTRQNVPLPPLPLQLAQFSAICNDNANNLKPVSSAAYTSNTLELGNHRRLLLPPPPPPLPSCGLVSRPPSIAARSNSLIGYPEPTTTTNSIDQVDTAPKITLQPPVRPRRRNLSNVSSTFGRPLPNINNRRRYDPSQLAEDLHKLDVREDNLSALDNSINGQVSSEQQQQVAQATSSTSLIILNDRRAIN